MHEANTALLDILVDNSVIVPSFQNRTVIYYLLFYSLAELQARTSGQKLQILQFFYLIHSRYP